MYKGYIIFLTKDFLDIVNNLIDTVILFSKYDVEITCINFEYNFNNDRIKTNSLFIDICDFFNITKCKIIATLNSKFDFALLLDGDMIVTPDIDKIFEENEERIKNYKCPLFAKHPHNPYNQWKHIVSKVIGNKIPKMNWVYSNYLFIKEQKWFFQETLNYMNSVPIYQHHLFYPVPEESILNALLIKYDVDYDLGYNYFPNGLDCVIDYYLTNNNDEGKHHINECYLSYDCPIKFYAFHGHKIKDHNYTKIIVEKIKQLKYIKM
jgi:hypothetical protein